MARGEIRQPNGNALILAGRVDYEMFSCYASGAVVPSVETVRIHSTMRLLGTVFSIDSRTEY